MNTTISEFRTLFCGMDTPVPTLSGKTVPYVNLDNAASTPALRHVQDCVNRFLTYYSSVHRGTGFKSQISTHAYETARSQMLNFVGADPKLISASSVKIPPKPSTNLPAVFHSRRNKISS